MLTKRTALGSSWSVFTLACLGREVLVSRFTLAIRCHMILCEGDWTHVFKVTERVAPTPLKRFSAPKKKNLTSISKHFITHWTTGTSRKPRGITDWLHWEWRNPIGSFWTCQTGGLFNHRSSLLWRALPFQPVTGWRGGIHLIGYRWWTTCVCERVGMGGAVERTGNKLLVSIKSRHTDMFWMKTAKPLNAYVCQFLL